MSFNVTANTGTGFNVTVAAGGGGPGSITWGAWQYLDPATNPDTAAAMAIGPADADRWVVVAAVLVNFTSSSISSMTIGGVSATLLNAYDPTGDIRTEFWKAAVPTGTTADVVVTLNAGSAYQIGVATYYATGEPTLHDSAGDEVITSLRLDVAIDVPAGGAVLAITGNEATGNLDTWTGVTADSTDNTARHHTASADGLSVQTGRAVEVTYTATFSVNDYLHVISLSIPSVGGGTTYDRAAAVDSVSTLAAVATVRRDRQVVAASTSSLAAVATVRRNRAAEAASTSSLAAVATVRRNRQVVAASTSSLAAVATIRRNRAAAFDSVSTLTAIGVRIVPGINRAAAMDSASTLAAVATIRRGRAAVIASASVLAAVATVRRGRAAVVAAASSLAAVATIRRGRAAVVASASALTVVATIRRGRAALMASVSSLAAVATARKDRAALMASASTLAALASIRRNRAAAFNSASSLAAVRTIIPGSSGYVKAWNGSAWVEKPVKHWNGSAWAIKPLKDWNGSAWIAR